MLYIWWTICVLGITSIAPTIIAAFINPAMWVIVVIEIIVSGFAAIKADQAAQTVFL